MPEFRLDPLRRRWVLTGKRPPMPDALDSGDLCAFCPGNERFTPKPICERLNTRGEWMVRVFHDRAPLLRVEGLLDREGEGMYDRMNAVGAHEVVVETRKHGSTLAALSEEEIGTVIAVWKERVLDLKRDQRLRYVSVFKNQRDEHPGHEGHAHSQVLAAPIIPPTVEVEFRWSLFQYERKERCLGCDIIQQERRHEKRIVEETAEFIALCPYASRAPYELWVLPIEHASSFEADVAAPERTAVLAALLKSSLQRVENVSRSLQMTVHTEPNLDAPTPKPDWWKTLREDYHWHIEIVPVLDSPGFPLGIQGLYFNPIPAEEAATVLRALAPRAPADVSPA